MKEFKKVTFTVTKVLITSYYTRRNASLLIKRFFILADLTRSFMNLKELNLQLFQIWKLSTLAQ